MNKPYPIERIVSSLSYITMGFAGFIYMLIGLFTRAQLRPFAQYHIFQSIFISILFFLLNYTFAFILNVLSYIPFINKLVAQLTFLLNAPLLLSYSIIQLVVFGLILYLTITSLLGMYTRIPYISDIIDQNTGRRH